MQNVSIEGVVVKGEVNRDFEPILNPAAQNFLAKMHRRFNPKRLSLLEQREIRQREISAGKKPDFLKETEDVRNDPHWRVAPIPQDLQTRKVEITGPTERKMMINALNSGASVFMADFEDSLSPTWSNVMQGQINLIDAIQGSLTFTSPEGKKYSLNEKTAVLMVRPRGWHLYEKHFFVDGDTISGSLFDFGLYVFHNGRRLLQKGSAPYFYIPKLESHLEARLWNDVFNFAEDEIGLERGTIRCTVLIETILAAFEMEEILYELKDHAAGLNAGRWDYIFSTIKKFHRQPHFLFPDRSQITMTVPFMKAYTDLLVKTCHKRGAHAMGGMAAFIPSRKDKEINAIALDKVKEDKIRESSDGFDGTWVAHPDLVSLAMEVFNKQLGSKPHQKEVMKDHVRIKAEDLLNFEIKGGKITEAGLRQNINVALQYIDSWLSGIGAAAIFNLMEDAATAEISRAQLWQWIHCQEARLEDGRKIDEQLYGAFALEEMQKLRKEKNFQHLEQTKSLLDRLALNKAFIDFFTIAAYELLP